MRPSHIWPDMATMTGGARAKQPSTVNFDQFPNQNWSNHHKQDVRREEKMPSRRESDRHIYEEIKERKKDLLHTVQLMTRENRGEWAKPTPLDLPNLEDLSTPGWSLQYQRNQRGFRHLENFGDDVLPKRAAAPPGVPGVTPLIIPGRIKVHQGSKHHSWLKKSRKPWDSNWLLLRSWTARLTPQSLEMTRMSLTIWLSSFTTWRTFTFLWPPTYYHPIIRQGLNWWKKYQEDCTEQLMRERQHYLRCTV